MERLTNQKYIILEYIRNVKTHPSAEEIYRDVKKKLPQISLGTVYRNLEKFVATGKILEINGTIKRFDGDMQDHQHFICNKCGEVYDIFCKNPQMKNFESHIHKIGEIKNYQISFYGTCHKCITKSIKK